MPASVRPLLVCLLLLRAAAAPLEDEHAHSVVEYNPEHAHSVVEYMEALGAEHAHTDALDEEMTTDVPPTSFVTADVPSLSHVTAEPPVVGHFTAEPPVVARVTMQAPVVGHFTAEAPVVARVTTAIPQTLMQTTPAIPQTPMQTTPAASEPLNLSSAIPKVAVIAGLETLGAVRVLFNAVPLGVPSFTADTAFHPFQGVRILVPAGAWVSNRRASAPRELTVSVFELPDGLATPGAVCGPALDLGPREQRLAKPIQVSVPCAATGPARVYAMNTLTGAWAADGTVSALVAAEPGAAWAETQSLGVHAAMLEQPVPVPTPVEAGGATGLEGRDIAGLTVGVAGFTLLAGGVVFCVRQHRWWTRVDKAEADAQLQPAAQLSFVPADT